ncbi:MAG: hypothetical protein K9G64_03220 [Bacteroidia bacterium]|nr:hypothetical protein [Bacteroidia bacterium]
MLNKIMLFIVLFLANIIANAQYITLEKNNSLDKIVIKTPKKLILNYQTDSGIIKIKGKVLSYQFPYLTIVKIKKDTLILNLKNIVFLRNHTNFATTLLYAAAFETSLISFAFFMDARYSGNAIAYWLISASAGTLTYYELKSANKRYNTKTKWSFY